MSAPHFFAGAPDPGEEVTLRDEEARHAARSLRLRPGDRFTSGDGEGGVATCVVERIASDEVVGRVEERRHVPKTAPRLTVLLAPPKGERLTWAVQKLTELGVDEITLVEAPRSVRRVRIRGLEPGGRLERVVHEAAKQSRRAYLPVIGGSLSWDEVIGIEHEDPLVILWERAERGLLGLLPAGPPERIALLVGPEGGIADEDARDAEKRGAILASLGPTILRTETAAVAAAAVTLARYGRLEPSA